MVSNVLGMPTILYFPAQDFETTKETISKESNLDFALVSEAQRGIWEFRCTCSVEVDIEASRCLRQHFKTWIAKTRLLNPYLDTSVQVA